MNQIKERLQTLHNQMLNHLVSDDEWMYTSELSNYIVEMSELVKLCEVYKVEKRVRICSDETSRWFAYRLSYSGPKFNTELEAIEWAEQNGYYIK